MPGVLGWLRRGDRVRAILTGVAFALPSLVLLLLTGG